LLVPYPLREARRSGEIRAQRMQAAYEEAGIVLDVVRCHLVEASLYGPSHWTDMRLTADAPPGAGEEPQATGLALWHQAQSSAAAGALAQRLDEAGYDFIQVEQAFLWPMLRRALRQSRAARRCCLVYSAYRPASGSPADASFIASE